MSSTQSAMDLIQFDGGDSKTDVSELNTTNNAATKESESVSIFNMKTAAAATTQAIVTAAATQTEEKLLTQMISKNIENTPIVQAAAAATIDLTDSSVQSSGSVAEAISINKPIEKLMEEVLPNMSSIVHIKEFILDNVNDEATSATQQMNKVPLVDAEEEEEDHLTPLMMDNHTVLEHQETFIDIDRVHEIPEFIPQKMQQQLLQQQLQQQQQPPSMKLCDKKDSIGSIDSDVSMSFDRRNSQSNPSGDSSDATSSDENAKDSGCDVTNNKNVIQKEEKDDEEEDHVDDGPIDIPDDELAEKIVQQVEFYFSNDNILKDAFLLKHVRRNKEGFVSLKLISSFKRVRQLTKDWRVVGYAIRLKSANIECNDINTKVRRLDALPVFDETMPSRTVVATQLPFEKVTIEKVSDIFSKCGEIALIRILRAGGSIPADVRQFINKYPDLQQQECALVEFVESQSARTALTIEGMQIYEMVAPKKKTGKKTSVSKMVENFKYPGHNDVERSRGGGGDDYKYHGIRRNSGGYYAKHDSPNHVCTRKISFNNNIENYDYNRRSSNCSTGSNSERKYSNCSDGYSSCNESRRPSMCSEQQSRRTSNCSEVPFRRTSNCSDFCPCAARQQQQQQQPQLVHYNDQYRDNRRISQCSEHSRRFSNNSGVYDHRKISNVSDSDRRGVSFDSDYERKISTGSIGGGFEYQRKISSGYSPIIRKVSNGTQFYNDSPVRKVSNEYYNDSPVRKTSGDYRKISSDSGYDRKASVSSQMSEPRSRKTSVNNATKAENLVRAPIGPDGSKGFSSRARKVGQVIGPV